MEPRCLGASRFHFFLLFFALRWTGEAIKPHMRAWPFTFSERNRHRSTGIQSVMRLLSYFFSFFFFLRSCRSAELPDFPSFGRGNMCVLEMLVKNGKYEGILIIERSEGKRRRAPRFIWHGKNFYGRPFHWISYESIRINRFLRMRFCGAFFRRRERLLDSLWTCSYNRHTGGERKWSLGLTYWFIFFYTYWFPVARWLRELFVLKVMTVKVFLQIKISF